MTFAAVEACGKLVASRRSWSVSANVALMWLVAGLLWGQGSSAVAVEPDTATSSGTNDSVQPLISTIDRSMAVTHHVITPDGTSVNAGALVGEVVYSNTTGGNLVALPLANVMIGDDIRTTTGCGCNLAGFEFQVYGGGSGTGPGPTVNYALYDFCPSGGGQVIAGTDGSFTLDNDGLSLVTVDTSGTGLAIGRAFWLGLTFDRVGAGWITGAPAEVGLTFDLYDLYATPCSASFQGTPLYAGFYARVFCESAGAPTPANGATDVPVETDLVWSGYGIDPTDGGSPNPGPGGGAAAIDPSWADNLEPGNFCATQARYEAGVQARGGGAAAGGGCTMFGGCDEPSTRDVFIPDAGTPMSTYSMFLHVFCEDDGSNCAASVASVDGTMTRVNADYAPYRIQFDYEMAFHNHSEYLHWSSNEENPMKSAFSVFPAESLNVFVVDVGGYSFGTFPWDPEALEFGGGIVMDKDMFGPNDSTLTHEAGHNLGLWHTHHGVSEVGECSACWEEPQSYSSTTGDRCADTDPTPTSWSCSPPGGIDPCSTLPWGQTDTDNFMGYAGSPCWDNFSDMQAGRMHCWTDDRLIGWLTSVCGATYDVYFDVDSPPTTLLCSGSDTPYCDPGVLTPQTTYYWRVVATNEIGVGEGPIWSFTTAAVQDCNHNGIPDSQDIAVGASLDCNGNLMPDECDTIAGGDYYPDGNVDMLDLPGFIDCTAGPGATPAPTVPDCLSACLAAFDFDSDGSVDLRDYSAFLQAASAP